MININGNWTGTITYGKEYWKFKGKELYFDMELAQHGEEFKGTAIDIGGWGISPDQAIVEGSITGNKIDFAKQYSSLHYFSNGKVKIDPSAKGNIIAYSGVFDEVTQTFQGEWVIRGKVKLFGFIPIHYKNTGTWTMRRK